MYALFPTRISIFLSNIDRDSFIEYVISTEVDNFELENLTEDRLIKYIEKLIPNNLIETYLIKHIDDNYSEDPEQIKEYKDDLFTYLEDVLTEKDGHKCSPAEQAAAAVALGRISKYQKKQYYTYSPEKMFGGNK